MTDLARVPRDLPTRPENGVRQRRLTGGIGIVAGFLGVVALLLVPKMLLAQDTGTLGKDFNSFTDKVYLPVTAIVKIPAEYLARHDVPYDRFSCPSTLSCNVTIVPCEESVLVEQNVNYTKVFNNVVNVGVVLTGDYTKKTFKTHKGCIAELRKKSGQTEKGKGKGEGRHD